MGTVDTGAGDDLERGSSEVIYLEFLFGFSQAIQHWTKQTLNASCEFGSVFSDILLAEKYFSIIWPITLKQINLNYYFIIGQLIIQIY